MIIPKLVELKKKGYHVTLLCYEPSHFKLFYKTDEPFKIYKENRLYDNILWISPNKYKLLKTLIKNLRKFDEAYTPIHTFFSSLRGRLLAKKYRYSFKDLHDDSKYKNIIQGTLDDKITSLFEYRTELKLEYNNNYKKKFGLENEKFITLFVGLCVRCIAPEEIKKVITFLNKIGYIVVLVGGDRERRIRNEIDTKEYKMADLLGKTDFLEISSILSDSALNISMDGGLMRLGHLMNKKNISIENTTSFIIQPPVDNVNSFNLREYTYPKCRPCIFFCMQERYREYGIKACIFHGTDREGECRFATKAENIAYLIKKILPPQ